LQEYLLSYENAENLLVVKTTPGNAQGVCAALDTMNWPEILGTLAGEDTFDLGPLGTRVRRLIETVGSQLTERFHIQRLKVRKGWTLLATWYRKILAHTMCAWLNKLYGHDPLDFEGLVTI
jgi:hypothetical protein